MACEVDVLASKIICFSCGNPYKKAKVLSCFHIICVSCFENKYARKLCPCLPGCLLPNSAGQATSMPLVEVTPLLETSPFIDNFIKTHKTMEQANLCGNCDDNAQAGSTCYCNDCEMFMCPSCLQNHKGWKPYKAHKVDELKPVNNITVIKCDVNCTIHDDEPLEAYCTTCDTLTCVLCTVKESHKDHDQSYVTEVLDSYLLKTQSSLNSLDQEMGRLAESARQLENTKDKIKRQCGTLKNEIKSEIEKLKAALNELEKQLTAKLERASEHKLNVLESQLKELKLMTDLLTRCKNYVGDTIEYCSPQQIISSHKPLMACTKDILDCFSNQKFRPLELPDFKVNIKLDHDVKQLLSDCLSIAYSLNIIRVDDTSQNIPLVNQESSISFSLSLPRYAVPVPSSLIKCHLVSPNNQAQSIECTVQESSQSGQYNVVFTPTNRGRHQLHVIVGGRSVSGCPITVPVSVPPGERKYARIRIGGINQPAGIAVFQDGCIVATECEKCCFTVFNQAGKKIKSFGSHSNTFGQFQNPQGVAITSRGTLLICDCGNNRIQEITRDGDFKSCVGKKGFGKLEFNSPTGIAINTMTNQIFIADKRNHRVQVLNHDLTYSHEFGEYGTADGEFDSVHDLTIDREGFVYVIDWANHRVQKFTSGGQFVLTFNTTRTKQSHPASHLPYPSGITIDNNNLLYLNFDGYNSILVYNTEGSYITCIKKNIETSDSHTGWLKGMACDKENLYVCYFSEHKIEII